MLLGFGIRFVQLAHDAEAPSIIPIWRGLASNLAGGVGWHKIAALSAGNIVDTASCVTSLVLSARAKKD